MGVEEKFDCGHAGAVGDETEPGRSVADAFASEMERGSFSVRNLPNLGPDEPAAE